MFVGSFTENLREGFGVYTAGIVLFFPTPPNPSPPLNTHRVEKTNAVYL